ncbi:uncharacterized protein G2W53_001892 [Senna tora]|uniref:Uncharacterized protein n=1 Tax=Senna tora TaxID=362788 RepID=A0A834XJQ0_9FABA|nr:uncharacterized protein G2W53_001892 [Senna tora]
MRRQKRATAEEPMAGTDGGLLTPYSDGRRHYAIFLLNLVKVGAGTEEYAFYWMITVEGYMAIPKVSSRDVELIVRKFDKE